MEVLGYITKPRHQTEETNSSADLEAAEYYFVPCKLKEPAQREVTASTDSRHCKSTSKLCFTTSEEKDERFIPKTAFNRFFANCLNKWPLSIQKGKSMIFCGGAVFCLEENHFLYIFLYEHVIQMWISRLSIDGQSPKHSVCLKTKDCVTSMLEENVKINSHFVLFVKCPEASLNNDETMMLLEGETDIHQDPIPCYCQGKEHLIVYEDLIKYWSDETTVLEMKLGSEFSFERIPTEKEFSHIAKEIGYEFKQLGFELHFSQAEIDQICIDNEIAVDRTRTLLLKWRTRAADNATFGELGAAMHRVGLDVAKAFKTI
ncbi:uncharacterized protein LOC123527922 isoform X2 [Mercenaria mercenaria]|uniref:uncharacterized protein LOC123527922 isoform X2 n=1 Tax=Mercenaria mercenaria TaxID=6596 RepID=UPI00234ED982|nr:uncharacterized protein LOC123527922 isoform X2 [Mercenaria mercenaria]